MKKYKKKEFGLTVLMLFGAGFALAVTVAATLVLAIVSSLTSDPTALCGAFSLLALILAGAISGFVTSKANGEGGVLISALSSVITAAVILIVGLIWKRGAVNLGVILNVLSFIGVSVLSALLSKKFARKPRGKYR